MTIQIQIAAKTLSDALESILLKGKYFMSGGTSRSDILSDYVTITAMSQLPSEHQAGWDGNYIQLTNGNATTVCFVRVPVAVLAVHGEICVEISKLLSFLKQFGKDEIVLREIQGKILIQSLTWLKKEAYLPTWLNHPYPASINKGKNLTLGTEVPYVFGKTAYHTMFSTTNIGLLEAMKGCDTVGNSKYRFELDTENIFSISSTEGVSSFKTNIPGTIVGEPSTAEMTGPFANFFSVGLVNVFIQDDRPLIFSSADRLLVKAPYIEG